MPGYLLDTNALSLLAPSRTATPAAAFRAWVRAHDDDLFLSVITLAEIQAGISQLERKRASRRAAELSLWLKAIVELYQPRTLPLESGVALETGRLLDRAIASGASPAFEEAAIAATAAVNRLIVVTANERHFRHFGVRFVAPMTR